MRSPLSDAELERRWAAVRRAMAEQDLDAVVMQNASDWVGGYVRWFTDVPATNGYPRTVVFRRDAGMTVVEMGAFGTVVDPPEGAGFRGVERVLGTPSFVSVGYTNGYDAELLAAELRRIGARRVGMLAPGALPHAIVEAVAALPQLETLDFTDTVDAIKAVKSDEEVRLIRQVAELQDRVFAEVCDRIRPGLTDIDVTNHAQAVAHRLGSDQGIFLGVSAPLGSPSRFMPRHFQGRTLEAGDHRSILIEVNGPGGMYLEIARTMVLGRASDELLQSFDDVRQAQEHTLGLLKPGAAPAAIAAAHDRWMEARGLSAERRLYAHGQGTDMVERPLIRRDETMPIAAGMCLAVHPGYDDGRKFAVICDNYMIEADGPGPCLHRTPKRIFELPA